MAKYYFQILLYSLSISFCILFPETASLTFKLTNLSDQDQNVNITTSGSGHVYSSSQGLELTCNCNQDNSNLKSQWGAAIYGESLHLWDKSTQKLADFNTHFVFAIDSEGKDFFDEFVFFLAPNGSNLPILPADSLPLVAVTFLANPDLSVGININSHTPNVTAVWYSNITHGIDNEAWISYDSSSYTLSVVFTGSTNTTSVPDAIHSIVDLTQYLPEQVAVGFSATGYSSDQYFEKNTVKSWELSSSLEDDETNNNAPGLSPVNAPVDTDNQNVTGTPLIKNNATGPVLSRKNSAGAVAGSVVGSSVLVAVSVTVGLHLWRKSEARKSNAKQESGDGGNEEDAPDVENPAGNEESGSGAKEEDESKSMEKEKGSGPKKFSYGQLSSATNNFDEEQKLGEGRLSRSYRCFLTELKKYIFVKRISVGSKQGIEECTTEVKIVSQLSHRNLVQLIDWCYESNELLVVYEFIENASLDIHLFLRKNWLTWGNRYKIAKDLASTLLYLHEEWEQCVVHGNIKSSNVMLDLILNAKLGDFGFARFVDHKKELETTLPAGTMGYSAPEYVETGKASKESDVYSFGIVLLEIACGRKHFDSKVPESQKKLVNWVWDLNQMGTLLKAVDPKLVSDFDEDEAKRLMIVGLWCAHPDHKLRPKIRQVIQVLKFEDPLPKLPPKE